MLQKAHIDHSSNGMPASNRARRHPIFETPGLDFVPHPISYDSPRSRVIPPPGSLILWRFRAEWRSISRDDARSWVSEVERERAKYHPNSALTKRYLIGRAALRRVLSGMLDCPAGTVQLADGVDGQPQLVRPRPCAQISIHVAYAGIWVIIGISSSGVGIGAVVPVPGAAAVQPWLAGNATPPERLLPDHLFPGMHTEAQQRARHAGLSRLAITGSLHPEPVVIAQYGAASIVNTSTEQRCHVLDLPMPGKISAAVALAQLITRVDAFGWIKD